MGVQRTAKFMPEDELIMGGWRLISDEIKGYHRMEHRNLKRVATMLWLRANKGKQLAKDGRGRLWYLPGEAPMEAPQARVFEPPEFTPEMLFNALDWAQARIEELEAKLADADERAIQFERKLAEGSSLLSDRARRLLRNVGR